ncbi:MAG TPA: GNAT family protein [Mycobacteriales bacterium]|nr:GNAT family protein [Mycobacteriales bacterium]
MGELTQVVLRARTEDDLDTLFRLAADLSTWEERNPGPPSPLTREAYAARLARPAEEQADAAAFVVDVDGVAVGTATLFGFDGYARHAEAGINLAPEVRGRGVGTEVIRQLVAFGFERRNLRRIHLQAIASNAAALRAYEKAGFVVEGRLREHAWVRGGYEDIVLMGILRSDHPSR